MTTDVGLELLNGLFKDLQIDQEWSEFSDRSFVWWPHRVAQRVVAGSPYEEDGDTLSWISVETDLFRTTAKQWAEIEKVFEEHAVYSSLSGVFWRNGVVRLRSAAPVHEEIAPFIRRVLALAAVEHLALSERWFRTLGQDLKIALSGTREVPDEMTAAALHLPYRDEPSRWGIGPLEGLGPLMWEASEGAIVATGDATVYAVEIPVGPNGGTAMLGGISDLVEVEARRPHPVLGAGLSVRLKLNLEPTEEEVPLRPLALNAVEVGASERAGASPGQYYVYQFGSWCVDPVANTLTHTSFFPSLLADPGAVFTLVMNEVNRSEWVARRFFGLDVGTAFERSRERNAEYARRKEAGESVDDLLAQPVAESTMRDIASRDWPY